MTEKLIGGGIAATAALLMLAACGQKANSDYVVLDGATLYDGVNLEPTEDARIVIANGLVSCVGTGETCPAPSGAREIDETGRWIVPGVVDAHVHFSQTAWFDGRPDTGDYRDLYPYEEVEAFRKTHPESYFRAYLCSGVTAVFDVGGFPWTWDMRERGESDVHAPHIAAAGPLVTHAPREELNLPGETLMYRLSDAGAGIAAVRYMSAFGSDAVKVWYLPVPPDQQAEIDPRVQAVAAEAEQLDIPLIVHATTLREAKLAVAGGADLLVHSVWDQPVDQEFIDLVKAHDTIYTPTLTVVDGYRRMNQAIATGDYPEVDDDGSCAERYSLERIEASLLLGTHPSAANIAANLDAMKARSAATAEMGAANLKRVFDAGITIAMGTDAGNPGTLHGPSVFHEMEAMQAAGLPAREVIRMSTANGAKAMNRDDIGRLAAGMAADLVILTADPGEDIRNMRAIAEVMKGGVLMPRAELARSGE